MPESQEPTAPIDGGPQPFDNVTRRLFEQHPQELWVLLQATGPDLPSANNVRHEPTRIPHQGSQELDTIIRIDQHRLAHIEFEADARPSRIHPRLLAYNHLLQRHYRKETITQHVIVMNKRRGRLPGQFRMNNLILTYHAVHLWELDPDVILAITSPNLWPLATLTQSTPELLERILNQIIAHTTRNSPRQRHLIDDTTILSTIHLPPATIRTIRQQAITHWKLDMVTDIRFLVPWVQEQIAESRQEGREEGREEGQLELAVKLCEHFVGPLHPEHHEQLSTLTPTQLQQLTITAHQFHTHDDLDTWLNHQP